MSNRFIIDDCGTLIDMVTRNTYDYVSEVCPLLNDIDSENAHVKHSLSAYMVDLNNCIGKCSVLEEENEQLKDEVYNEIDNALTVLKELYEVSPLNLQKKMNQLYNRLESLREEMK